MRTTVGKLGDCFGLILDTTVRVPHRHIVVGVPSQFSCLRQTDSIPQKLRDVRVTPYGVEVDDPIVSLVWNPNTLRVFLDHQPGSSIGQFWEQEVVRTKSDEPLSKHDDQMRMERQHAQPPVL